MVTIPAYNLNTHQIEHIRGGVFRYPSGYRAPTKAELRASQCDALTDEIGRLERQGRVVEAEQARRTLDDVRAT